MLRRKKSSPASASPNSHRSAGRKAEAKPAARRRFVITSSARRNAAKAPDTNGKGKHTATSIAEAEKRLQNGHTNGSAPTPAQPSIDLTETIKTLLHLAQEHGYITYDDINDILPDNLSPDDLDALLTKLRSLDVEIVMDQAEAERAERTKQPDSPQEEVDEDARLEILDDPVRMYMNQMAKSPCSRANRKSRSAKKSRKPKSR